MASYVFLICTLKSGERALFNLQDISSIVQNRQGGCLIAQFGEEPWEVKEEFHDLAELIIGDKDQDTTH